MKEYYDRRAREYDDWWLGRGAWSQRERPGWSDEVGELCAALRRLPPRRTLDAACGTGFLTQHLPGEVVGLDASRAMVALARRRVPAATVVVGDALALPFGDAAFDRVFSSYFYCHLLPDERRRFLAEARRVAGELVVVGRRRTQDDPAERWERRVLRDGSRWQVFKRVFEPDRLAAELRGDLLHAGRWFVAVVSG